MMAAKKKQSYVLTSTTNKSALNSEEMNIALNNLEGKIKKTLNTKKTNKRENWKQITNALKK